MPVFMIMRKKVRQAERRFSGFARLASGAGGTPVQYRPDFDFLWDFDMPV